jgi:UDP-N-acetylglucosamine 2-epimerase (non-hydrolysing)
MKKKIMFVAGARPNFVKIAPLMREFAKQEDVFETFLVHTGQHYGFEMSGVFFEAGGLIHEPKKRYHECAQ